jgi:hypothetical protein
MMTFKRTFLREDEAMAAWSGTVSDTFDTRAEMMTQRATLGAIQTAGLDASLAKKQRNRKRDRKKKTHEPDHPKIETNTLQAKEHNVPSQQTIPRKEQRRGEHKNEAEKLRKKAGKKKTKTRNQKRSPTPRQHKTRLSPPTTRKAAPIKDSTSTSTCDWKARSKDAE